MDKGRKQKGQNVVNQTNVLESLKDVGGTTVKSLRKDLVEKAPKDALEQIFGPRPQSFSGEITPGESLEIDEVLSGRHQETHKLKMQLRLERRLREEEKERTEKKRNELRIQLYAITEEIATLSSTTQKLGEEVQIAAMQAPVEPGVYHLIFFEKLIEFIKSFVKKLEDASVWLQATNKRAQKKNYWARYKKHGGKFLLSGEHYLTRSAG